MSNPREDWWVSAKNAIRAYPGRRRKLEELRRTALTPHYGPAGSSGGIRDPVQNAAARTLPPQQQRELEAVEAALEQTERLPNGAQRLRLIDLYYFRQTHKLIGAGEAAGYREAQAKRINGEFVRLVGRNLGYIGKDDTPEPETCAKVVS